MVKYVVENSKDRWGMISTLLRTSGKRGRLYLCQDFDLYKSLVPWVRTVLSLIGSWDQTRVENKIKHV